MPPVSQPERGPTSHDDSELASLLSRENGP